MPTQDLKLMQHLKQIWQAAYDGVIQDFDYTGQTLARQRMTRLRATLYNYRRKIRTKRTSPTYAEEWLQISSCELTQLSPTRIQINKRNSLLFQRKQDQSISSPTLPFPLKPN